MRTCGQACWSQHGLAKAGETVLNRPGFVVGGGVGEPSPDDRTHISWIGPEHINVH